MKKSDSNEILAVLKSFENECIHYFILRDYDSIDNIVDAVDIDIYIDKKDVSKVNKLLKKDGWHRNIINDNKYPHFQYVKIVNSKIVKLDFVCKLVYGKNNYSMRNINIPISFNRRKNGVFVCDSKIAIITMLFHIIFDKEKITKKNHDILKCMYNDLNDIEKNELDVFFVDMCKTIIADSLEKTNTKIDIYQKNIVASGYTKCNIIFNIFDKIRIRTLYMINRIIRRVEKNSIAIIGVDGSGKSTAIESLSSIYGDKGVVVYMGLKEFKNKKLKQIVEMKESDMSIKDKIMLKLFLYVEMLRRYFEYRFSYKIVIYDRYVEDNYINSLGRFKYIDNFFYQLLFPKAFIYFYFYCDVNTSFSRKNDIYDKDGFILMKERYDKKFLNKKRVISINTNDNSKEQTVDIVCDSINKFIPRSML